MNFTSRMVDKLHEIRRIECGRSGCQLDVPAEQLGDSLIALYYATEATGTRVLITQMLSEAGEGWLRKLVTSQHQQFSLQEPVFKTASMDDYLTVLAANDDFEQSVQDLDIVR